MTPGKSAGYELTPVVPSLPVAATTTTSLEIAYATAARMAGLSSSVPKDMFIT